LAQELRITLLPPVHHFEICLPMPMFLEAFASTMRPVQHLVCGGRFSPFAVCCRWFTTSASRSGVTSTAGNPSESVGAAKSSFDDAPEDIEVKKPTTNPSDTVSLASTSDASSILEGVSIADLSEAWAPPDSDAEVDTWGSTHESAVDDNIGFSDIVSGAARKVDGLPWKRTQKQRRRPRVDARTMRVPVPDPRDLEDTFKALAAVEVDVEQGGLDELKPAVACNLSWGPKSEAWEDLLHSVRRNHAWRIYEELGPDTVLSPVYPEEHVQQRFLRARNDLNHMMSIGYHGTKRTNLSGIARKGLLVPGSKSGIKVQNGSAHGVGVYTARVGKASLSKGFSDSGALFVCAICDTSCEPDSVTAATFVPSSTHVMSSAQFPKRGAFTVGRQNVKQASDEVLHVGDAIVVFEDRCVVPLFLASPPKQCLPRLGWEKAQKVGRRRIAVPDTDLGVSGIMRRGPGTPQIGETVWTTPLPLQDVTGAMKAAKRRFTSRARDRCKSSLKRGKQQEFWQHQRECEQW